MTAQNDLEFTDIPPSGQSIDYEELVEQLGVEWGDRLAPFPAEIVYDAAKTLNNDDVLLRIIDYVCDDVYPDPNLIDEPTHLEEVADERALRLKELVQDYCDDPDMFEL